MNTNEPINESAKCVTPTHLSPSARSGEPEPGGVCGDAGHGGGGHEVAHGVRPPGVVVVLVDEVLPGDELREPGLGLSLTGWTGLTLKKKMPAQIAGVTRAQQPTKK